MSLTYYTNYIEGLPDRFRYRNTIVDLYQPLKEDDKPKQQRFPTSSDEFDSDAYHDFDANEPAYAAYF